MRSVCTQISSLIRFLIKYGFVIRTIWCFQTQLIILIFTFNNFWFCHAHLRIVSTLTSLRRWLFKEVPFAVFLFLTYIFQTYGPACFKYSIRITEIFLVCANVVFFWRLFIEVGLAPRYQFTIFVLSWFAIIHFNLVGVPIRMVGAYSRFFAWKLIKVELTFWIWKAHLLTHVLAALNNL